MADTKLFVGHALRRLRRDQGLTQVAMAAALDISASYLNLLERNGRPLTASVLMRLTEQFDFDPRSLSANQPAGGSDAMRRRLADPLFADLAIDRTEIEEWLAAAPGGAEAFARAFDRGGGGRDDGSVITDPISEIRREIERWRNHFPDLDGLAEQIADELRLGAVDLYGALIERLRVRHQLSVRILPVDILPDVVRRIDLHARQLQLSETLAHDRRVFAAAYQLGMIEAQNELDALVRGAGFADRTAQRLYRRHLCNYFAAGIVMPYARFLRACEGTGYDVDLIARRFDVGFESLAHRLTTLQRVGARGLPFFMLRADRSGQISKRFAGASNAALVEGQTPCPLWNVTRTFEYPDRLLVQAVELEGGERWLTLSRSIRKPGVRYGDVEADFSVGVGVEASQAAELAQARGIDTNVATPVGLGCRACFRECPQRSAAPAGRALSVNDRERGMSGLTFAVD